MFDRQCQAPTGKRPDGLIYDSSWIADDRLSRLDRTILAGIHNTYNVIRRITFVDYLKMLGRCSEEEALRSWENLKACDYVG